MKTTVVCALYKFTAFNDFESFRAPLQDLMKEHDVRGTLLLASEGINGTVAGSRDGIDALLHFLQSDPRLADLDYKESYDNENPFYREAILRSSILKEFMNETVCILLNFF